MDLGESGFMYSFDWTLSICCHYGQSPILLRISAHLGSARSVISAAPRFLIGRCKQGLAQSPERAGLGKSLLSHQLPLEGLPVVRVSKHLSHVRVAIDGNVFLQLSVVLCLLPAWI